MKGWRFFTESRKTMWGNYGHQRRIVFYCRTEIVWRPGIKYLLRKSKFLCWLISCSLKNHCLPTGLLRYVLSCHSSAQNIQWLPIFFKSYHNLQGPTWSDPSLPLRLYFLMLFPMFVPLEAHWPPCSLIHPKQSPLRFLFLFPLLSFPPDIPTAHSSSLWIRSNVSLYWQGLPSLPNLPQW